MALNKVFYTSHILFPLQHLHKNENEGKFDVSSFAICLLKEKSFFFLTFYVKCEGGTTMNTFELTGLKVDGKCY